MDQSERPRRQAGVTGIDGATVPSGLAAPTQGGRKSAPGLHQPWPAGTRSGAHADARAGLAVGPAEALPLIGVERRLVRRAEALWDQLRQPGGLPEAGAIKVLETPMFADNAVLFALPPHPSDPCCRLPRILRVGRKIAELGIVSAGPVAADGGAEATVAARLAALVERAVAGRAPVVVEIDAPDRASGGAPGDPARGDAARRQQPGLLLRAIALPFAAPGGMSAPAGPLAVVIASWRMLLSADEAADLQRELAAALEWLRGTH